MGESVKGSPPRKSIRSAFVNRTLNTIQRFVIPCSLPFPPLRTTNEYEATISGCSLIIHSRTTGGSLITKGELICIIKLQCGDRAINYS